MLNYLPLISFNRTLGMILVNIPLECIKAYLLLNFSESPSSRGFTILLQCFLNKSGTSRSISIFDRCFFFPNSISSGFFQATSQHYYPRDKHGIRPAYLRKRTIATPSENLAPFDVRRPRSLSSIEELESVELSIEGWAVDLSSWVDSLQVDLKVVLSH